MQEEGVHIINKMVSLWTTKYQYLTTFIALNQKTNCHEYMCEFSRPIPDKPNPISTIKVYFFLNFDKKPISYGKNREEENDDQKSQNFMNPQIQKLTENIEIRFRFENDSLYHNPRSTINTNMIEKWLEKYLDQKQRTSQVLFLGTEFEKTRIKDKRMEQIVDQINYKPVRKQVYNLEGVLLEGENELEEIELLGDESMQFKMMRCVLFDSFRAYDKLDVGMMSFHEFQKILQLLNINLNQQQLTNLFNQLDTNKNGLVEFGEWVRLGGEIVFGLFQQNQVQKMLKIKEEEFLILAIMTLVDDPIHQQMKELVVKLEAEDEDEIKKIQLVELEKILSDEKYQFSEMQIDDLLKIFRKQWGNMIPFNELPYVVVDFKINNLKNGMMESSYSKMELYLIEIFEEFKNEKKPECINLDNILKAIKKQKKIILSDIQIYLLQSIMDIDDDGLVNYRVGCRLLGEMIKRFFAPKCKQKLSSFLATGNVMLDEFMVGWSQQDIASEMESIKQAKNQIFDQETFQRTVEQIVSENQKQSNGNSESNLGNQQMQVLSNLILGQYDFNSLDYEKLYDQYVRFRVKKCVTGFEDI